ncbi:two-component system LytT family response regulator [Duganella sp. SG902]|uniref:LytR/AlgR family response regulator transcription factor n=1 Tax=Duganella sp. SG902 TaxID=2587016 RepID=UPI00159D3638|nr:LytTR family DNA-binding domain-containing protein [Duganella sp. SG902]NVM77493.1 two-component system LytT family response regulator [Duganella sp. SG902]
MILEVGLAPRTVFIAEDEPLAREVLRDAIYAHAGLRLVGEAADGARALSQISELRPDIVFMDIQMPEMTGVEVLARLNHTPDIVFTTAYDRYAVAAFELNAVDYLLKPFTRARFDAAVARLMECRRSDSEVSIDLSQVMGRKPHQLKRIFVRDRGRIFALALDEIEYIKTDSKYTAIVARGQTFLVRAGITEIEAQLDLTRFFRVHRSALINLDYVDSMKTDDRSRLLIRMRDGSSLTASRETAKILRDMAF